MIASNSSLQREEYLKKKRNRKLLRWVGAFFGLIFIIGGASYISHRPSIRISDVLLSGQVLVAEAEIKSETLSYLHGSYLWLFPKNNAFIYPRNDLIKNLKNEFKRIDTVNVHLKNFHTLAIDVTERKPVALWCDTLPGQDIPPVGQGTAHAGEPEHCYFMDGNSTIFAEAPQFSGDAYFKYYGTVFSEDPIGSYYISSSTKFLGMIDFVETARKLAIQPLYIVAKNAGEFSLVLHGGGQIYFDTKEPLSKIVSNLEALLRTPALKISLGQDLSIDYIDLRFGNKLFYKLK